MSVLGANAKAYAADVSVLGVIGTYNSGCAAAMIPILNTAPRLAPETGGGKRVVAGLEGDVVATGSPARIAEHDPDRLVHGQRALA